MHFPLLLSYSYHLILPTIMSSPSQSPSLSSSSPECKPRPNKKHHSTHHEHECLMSPATHDCCRMDKWQCSPSPSSPSTHESCKHWQLCSHRHSHPDTGSWGAHPNLPFICHMGTCNACQAYGEYLTLASFHHDKDFLGACQGLNLDNLAHLLDHSPTATWKRWCHEVDNHADRLHEENDTLQVKLMSLGASQQPPAQPQGVGLSSQRDAPPAESFSGGRVRGTMPHQSSMSHQGEILQSSLSSSHPQAPMPMQRELFLTSSALALHEPTHIKGDICMDANPEQPVLSERISDVKRSLNNMEGQLFPDPNGLEQPSKILVLRQEDDQNRQVQALFIQYWDMLYVYTDGAV